MSEKWKEKMSSELTSDFNDAIGMAALYAYIEMDPSIWIIFARKLKIQYRIMSTILLASS